MKNKNLDYIGEEEYYKGKIIALRYFYFESQALLYAARLRDKQIKCFVSNTNSNTSFPLGNAGIGLHTREIDFGQSLKIIKEMDNNDRNGSQHISFHDADQEDIAYERSLTEQGNKKIPLLILFLFIFSLIIFRALMRANGGVFGGDPF
jgi:hypothetical protein